jgi:hypothetical protein
MRGAEREGGPSGSRRGGFPAARVPKAARCRAVRQQIRCASIHAASQRSAAHRIASTFHTTTMLDATVAPDWLVALFALGGRDVPSWLPQALACVLLLAPLPFLLLFALRARPRQTRVPPYRERVLLLGASSGVGRALARQYAARGCTDLVLVGRREAELEKVRQECEELRSRGEEWEMSGEAPGWEARARRRARVIVADCTKPEDVLRIRDECLEGKCDAALLSPGRDQLLTSGRQLSRASTRCTSSSASRRCAPFSPSPASTRSAGCRRPLPARAPSTAASMPVSRACRPWPRPATRSSMPTSRPPPCAPRLWYVCRPHGDGGFCSCC